MVLIYSTLGTYSSNKKFPDTPSVRGRLDRGQFLSPARCPWNRVLRGSSPPIRGPTTVCHATPAPSSLPPGSAAISEPRAICCPGYCAGRKDGTPGSSRRHTVCSALPGSRPPRAPPPAQERARHSGAGVRPEPPAAPRSRRSRHSNLSAKPHRASGSFVAPVLRPRPHPPSVARPNGDLLKPQRHIRRLLSMSTFFQRKKRS